jgi:MFS family permease
VIDARAGQIFYGWYVVGALFFTQLIGLGARQGFGVFVETWQEAFGAGVATVSLAASVGWLVNGLSQPLLGHWTDRFGGRPVLIGSMATSAGPRPRASRPRPPPSPSGS